MTEVVTATRKGVRPRSNQMLFLDTNVFLSFFHFSSDDLEALRKLTMLVKRAKVTLLLPDQVVQEFSRNRDGKVAEALKQLGAAKLPSQYPRLCQDYPEYRELRTKLGEYEHLRRALLEKVQSVAGARQFPADQTTSELFAAATLIVVEQDVYERAQLRYGRGNPPGKHDKRESFGDAINWEALLGSQFKGDLYFVAEDADWASPLDSRGFNSYLNDEWIARKGGGVHFYQRLSGFLNDYFPDIKLESELEKDTLIDELGLTRNFAETHKVIAALTAAGDLTGPQLNAIVSAFLTNDQVHRIVGDPDVKEFLLRNLLGREDEVDPASLQQLARIIEKHAYGDPELQVLAASLALSGAASA